MARPTELKVRVPKTLNFEYEEFKEFEAIVGKDNVSREVRAMIKHFIETEKKGEALLDPLNQVRGSENSSIINNAEFNINILSIRNDKIIELVDQINDVETLAKIESNGKIFHDVARRRKFERLPFERMKTEDKKK